MNKISYLIIFFFLINNCSFDNKTGIWTGSNEVKKNNKNNTQNTEFVFKNQNKLIEEIELTPEQSIKIDNLKTYTEWSQRYQNKFNNINNVSFFNDGNYKKLSKISKSNINKNILVYKNNLFFSDYKGNIGVYSLNESQIIFKYNFYKKKFKKFKKEIKLIVKKDKIIAVDNFGYAYSLDYKKNKLVWAKNFLIPFRSNLKIINETLFLSDENNKIILINIHNGDKIDEFYTQPSKVVSKFESNLAIDNNNNLLFMSTSGVLYSLNLINNKRINWIKNFKQESKIIYEGNPIIIQNDNIIISDENSISLLNVNGNKIWDLNIKSDLPPIISGNTIFAINKENFLLLINSNNGQIKYSKSINSLITKDFKNNLKRKIKKIDHIYLTDDKLLLISRNSYFIEINIKNIININSIKKNHFEISSDIVFLNKEMIFINKSNRIYKVN
tara:strand:- start:3036 stop:4364 length:1329 start_codon:yes stop_codon:yes gene_type:complete